MVSDGIVRVCHHFGYLHRTGTSLVENIGLVLIKRRCILLVNDNLDSAGIGYCCCYCSF